MVLRKDAVLASLQKMRAEAKKRNFPQSVDFTVVFKGLDFKKPESKIDVSVKMPFATSKQGASKALVFVEDKDFANAIRPKAARVVLLDEIPSITAKEMEKFITEFDVFLAQGPAMLAVAKNFGQILAPRGRMPRLIQPNATTFEEELSTASTVVKVSNKKGKNLSFVHSVVGKENDADEKLAENVMAVYNAVEAALPVKEQNVSYSFVKFTMSPPVRIGEKASAVPKGESK